MTRSFFITQTTIRKKRIMSGRQHGHLTKTPTGMNVQIPKTKIPGATSPVMRERTDMQHIPMTKVK